MNTTTTLVNQTTGCTTSPRPKAAAIAPCDATGRELLGTAINGSTAGASWLVASRKSMTVPAFHDRWPLCSST